jgi:hypothetical protein
MDESLSSETFAPSISEDILHASYDSLSLITTLTCAWVYIILNHFNSLNVFAAYILKTI